VEGTQTRRRWLQRATVYALSMTLAGALTGLAFSAAGRAVDEVWPDAHLPFAFALGVAALAYALHELELIRLPVPGRDWQVPAGWVRHNFYRSAAIFGGTVGFGVITRVPYATFPILLAWLFVAGDPIYGVAAGLLYGALRALSIYSSAGSSAPEDLVGLNQQLMRLTPLHHQLAGLALAAFAAYLLLAPALS